MVVMFLVSFLLLKVLRKLFWDLNMWVGVLMIWCFLVIVEILIMVLLIFLFSIFRLFVGWNVLVIGVSIVLLLEVFGIGCWVILLFVLRFVLIV